MSEYNPNWWWEIFKLMFQINEEDDDGFNAEENF